MGRQTRRKSYHAVRKRKYMMRRFLLLIALLALIAGLTYVLVLLFSGDEALPDDPTDPNGTINGSMEPEEPQTPEQTPSPELPLTLRPSSNAAEWLTQIGFSSSIMYDRDEVTSFSRTESISFSRGSDYTNVKGITTFAGNNYRDSFVYGVQEIKNKTLIRIWEVPTGSLTAEYDGGTWTGTGWTGMPLIVEWDADVRAMLGVYDEFKHKEGFTEVIYPAMDGKIYFLELSSGKPTRDALNLGIVTKGTASLDPRGYPLLYTGQGLQSTQDGVKGAWFRVISLIDNTVLWSFGGRDPFSYRLWQAYDSSAIFHAESDTLITGGENGVLYSVKLNTDFNREEGTISVNPGPLAKYRYSASGYGERDDNRWWGIENSVTAWRNYVFFTDNGGYLQCVDINTLTPVYVLDVTDDSDTSLVLEEDYDNNTFYLYTANEVDKQSGTGNGYGKSYHRKIDGITGEVLWQVEWEASVGNTSSNGGTLSTPHVGKGNISDLVIFNSTLVPVSVDGITQNGGRIVAYDKKTGTEVWRFEQSSGYWSSPVVVYNESNEAFLIQCDRNGMMRIHNPRTCEILFELDMGSRIESTPAVFGNMLVVGTRGQYGSGESQKIIGVRIG